ncbi:MAG: S8 family serine peptidase [Promethearchaeota archaeon]
MKLTFFYLSIVLSFSMTVWVARGEEPRRLEIDGVPHGPSVPPSTSIIRSPELAMTRKYKEHQVVAHLPEIIGEQNISQIAQENGFRFVKSLKGSAFKDYYIFERSNILRNEPHDLIMDERIVWWQDNTPQERIKKQAIKQRYKRPHPTVEKRDNDSFHWTPPSDPLFVDQWHLAPGRNENSNHVHINAEGAWRQGYTGRGIRIGVVDDGLQKAHPDLSESYNADLSWDFNEDDDDPSPKHGDSHGTSASGVAGADRDTTCGVGVAYGARLVGLRLLGSWETDSTEGEALSHQCSSNHPDQVVDIYSCSWGPTDDGKYLTGPGRMVLQAWDHCINQGRGGKGSIYVWAGGNGRWDLDNSNYDGFANSIYTIAVGAVNHQGAHTWYSEPGANLLCSAPSSGISMRVITTDLKGREGDSQGDCTWNFGGTSAAAPEVAGMVALILQANPDLTWREVQDVIAKSCDKTEHSLNEPYVKNAAGFIHSHDIGFGKINAGTAVQVAREYNRDDAGFEGEQKHFSTGTLESPVTRVQLHHSLIIYWEPNNIDAARRAINQLEHVTVSIDFGAQGRSRCLGLDLLGPSGINSTLSEAGNGLETHVKWTYMTVRHWGEPLVYDSSKDVRSTMEQSRANALHVHTPSRWSLRIRNMCTSASVGHSNSGDGDIVITSWRIDFYGH